MSLPAAINRLLYPGNECSSCCSQMRAWQPLGLLLLEVLRREHQQLLQLLCAVSPMSLLLLQAAVHQQGASKLIPAAVLHDEAPSQHRLCRQYTQSQIHTV